jgi:hypothetical protein
MIGLLISLRVQRSMLGSIVTSSLQCPHKYCYGNLPFLAVYLRLSPSCKKGKSLKGLHLLFKIRSELLNLSNLQSGKIEILHQKICSGRRGDMPESMLLCTFYCDIIPTLQQWLIGDWYSTWYILRHQAPEIIQTGYHLFVGIKSDIANHIVYHRFIGIKIVYHFLIESYHPLNMAWVIWANHIGSLFLSHFPGW